MWHPKQPGPDVQVSLCTEHCHGTRHSWPLSSEANGMIDVKRVIAKQWAVPERCLGISGRGLWSWTTLRFQLAGVSPVNSMNAAPPFPAPMTQWMEMATQLSYLRASGLGRRRVRGEGTGQSCSHPGSPPAQLPVAKAECRQQPISCTRPPRRSPGGRSRLIYCRFYWIWLGWK